MKSDKIKKIIKLAISIALLIFIINRIDLIELLNSVMSVDIVLFISSLLITASRVLLSAHRWKKLLKSKKIHSNFWRLTNYYMVGSFYNLIFPSVLGGDTVRMLMLSKEIDSKSEALSSIFIERFMGFFSLSIIALFSLISGLDLVKNSNVSMFVIILFLTFIALFFLLFKKSFITFFFKILKRVHFEKVLSRFEKLYNTFYSYKNNKTALAYCFFISMVYQVLGIIIIYILGISIGIDIKLSYYLIFVPLIWIIMMIPLSISGFGIRESAFVYFFSISGVTNESALLLSILFFSHSVITGLLGGLLSLFSGSKIKIETVK